MQKQKTDHCLRGVSQDGSLKIWVADTTRLCDEARAKHQAWSVATAALGRLLTAGAFFGLNLKGDDTVTLKIDGDGPLGSLAVVANAKGEVRGYVANPQVDIPRVAKGKLDVGGAVGAGTLTVIKDMGFGEPYSGSIQLATGEIGDDVAKYYLESEQTASAVGLGVLVDTDGSVKAAGGFLVQLLPNADDRVISQLELNIANLIPVSTMIENGLTTKEIADEVLLGIPWQQLTEEKLTYKCTCSHQRMGAALLSLGSKEVQAIIEEQGQAQLSCKFCGAQYDFAKPELEAILKEADQKQFREFAQRLGVGGSEK